MRISQINNNLTLDKNKKMSFTGNFDSVTANKPKESYIIIKNAVKNAKNSDITKEYADDVVSTTKKLKDDCEKAVPKKVPPFFIKFVQKLGKVKTGSKVMDSASMLTKIVLWGNVGKEVVGTFMYTVQALTNQDLPEDKRKFVGMYDLSVGVVSTICSFAFGVGLEKTIKKGYEKLLKPLRHSTEQATRSRSYAAIAGLAALTSFGLQVIVGKRIIAPAIATPAAGKLKKKLEDADAAKKSKFISQKDALNVAIAAQKAQDVKAAEQTKA